MSKKMTFSNSAGINYIIFANIYFSSQDDNGCILSAENITL
jgi:hypothetical protein